MSDVMEDTHGIIYLFTLFFILPPCSFCFQALPLLLYYSS